MSGTTPADRLCRWLERTSLAVVGSARRDWIRALHAEATAVPRGWRRVAWLTGGLRFAVALSMEDHMHATASSPRSAPSLRDVAAVAFFVVSLLVAKELWFAATRDWSMAERDDRVRYMIATVILVSTVVTVSLRARWAAIGAVGLVVMALVEVVVHGLILDFGGWDAHMAPVFAATIGAALVLLPRLRTTLARFGPIWPALAALLAFTLAEAIAWRWIVVGLEPFRTPWVNLVVAAAACCGVALACLVRARFDDPPTVTPVAIA